MSVELAFDFANKGCDLEEESVLARRAGRNKEFNALRKSASEQYAKSIELLLELKPHTTSPQILGEMIEFLLSRMNKMLMPPVSSKTNKQTIVAQIDPAQTEMRRKIANEILQTEQTYSQQLLVLVNKFQLRYLQEGVLTPEEDAVCFAGLSQISELSIRMLQSLNEAMEQWDAKHTTLGNVFCLYSSFFKMYIPFANNFQRGQAILASKQDQIAGEVHNLRIAPIQRVPRYMLLLRELIKYTPSTTHPDFPLLERAVKEIGLVAQQINERMASSELEAKVFEIQSSLWSATTAIPELLSPGRVFKKQGPMAKLRSNGQVKRNYYLFAFNDIVVYTTRNPLFKQKFHFRNALDFYGAFPCDEEVPTGKLKYGECAFKITGSNGYRIFIAANDAERREWLEALQSSATEKEEKRRSWGRARNNSNAPSPVEQRLVQYAEEEEEDGLD